MKERAGLSAFAKYAWFTLAYNILVILWGVFLRASKSGDGCGQHWLTCHGEVIPSAPELKTVIEFSHRITSALDGLVVIILVVWALIIWYGSRSEHSKNILTTAIGCLIFVIIEGLIGAGLVLTGNTAETLTLARPFWMAGHLINTLVLLTFLTLTAWFASGGGRLRFPSSSKVTMLLIAAVIGFFLIGMSGSVAALSSMLFPSDTLIDGISKDFSQASNILLRLRLSHPLLSILTSVYLLFLAGWLKKRADDDPEVTTFSNLLSLSILIQLGFGAATLLTLAPIVMQLGHLLLADAMWVSFVLLTAAYLSREWESPLSDSELSFARSE